MDARTLTGVVAVAAALVAAGPASSASTKTVRLSGVEFSPKTLRISKNTKVRFAFQDNGIVHNVTPVGSKKFRFSVKGKTRSTSGNRASGAVTTLAFKKSGTYRYVCTIHQTGGMTGRIVVK